MLICRTKSASPKTANFVFQISNFDGMPSVVCESCCDKSINVYAFIQLILTTQRMFLKNLNTVDLIKTNKNKVVQRFALEDTEKSGSVR